MLQPTVLQLKRLFRPFHRFTAPPINALARAPLRKVATRIGICVGLLGTALASAEEVRQGPDVVIIAGDDKVVYEFRQNGQLRMVRVVPKWGKPYYLVPRDGTQGFGDLERADMLLPQWVIAEF